MSEGRFERSFQQPDKESGVDRYEKLRDPNYLPTHKDVEETFQEDDENFFRFFRDKEKPVYELFNEEHVDALADYLVERIEGVESGDKPVTILEVGAGNGRLSHFLRQKLEAKAPGRAQVIATDSGAWKIEPETTVEKLDHKEALEKYQPDIVLMSWMPRGVDLTADFRAMDSVREYILIGEAEEGTCGDEYLTWGLTQRVKSEERKKAEQLPAPYKQDGFEREDLDEVSKHQICRTDSLGDYHYSTTVSFRRTSK